MGQHAILAPSGGDTWISCVAAPLMQKGLPDEANQYTDEGTAAHLLGSDCLETGKNPEDFRGLKIYVGSSSIADFDGAVWALPSDYDFDVRRTFTVDDDMCEHIAKYVDKVRAFAQGAELLLPEQRVPIGAFTGEEGARGTSDAAVVLDGELQVHDLKYGMGVRVSAERNRQLMLYALGVRRQLDPVYGPFKRIRLVIHQPRLDSVSEWDCSPEELDTFAAEVAGKSARAMVLYRGEDTPGELDFAPSEDACRWCKAKPTCPALKKHVEETFAVDFEALPEEPPEYETATPEELSKMMARVPLLEMLAKAMRARVEGAIFSGVKVPGWKIVAGRQGPRAWTDVEKADELFKSMRVREDVRYNMTLRSPTQLEKVFKDEPRRWKRVVDAGLITRSEGQPSVAPESDKRPEWTPPDTSSDFEAITEGAPS